MDQLLSQKPERSEEEGTVQQKPDPTIYMQRISELSAEDQAFMDGYLFAKVTEAAKQKGA